MVPADDIAVVTDSSGRKGWHEKVFKGDVIITLEEDEKGKVMYAMLLASYMASKPVRVVVDDKARNVDGSCKAIALRVNR